jgi:hypothetical protein
MGAGTTARTLAQHGTRAANDFCTQRVAGRLGGAGSVTCRIRERQLARGRIVQRHRKVGRRHQPANDFVDAQQQRCERLGCMCGFGNG